MEKRIKNNRTITIDGKKVSVYDMQGVLLLNKTFSDALKAMIVFKTL